MPNPPPCTGSWAALREAVGRLTPPDGPAPLWWYEPAVTWSRTRQPALPSRLTVLDDAASFVECWVWYADGQALHAVADASQGTYRWVHFTEVPKNSTLDTVQLLSAKDQRRLGLQPAAPVRWWRRHHAAAGYLWLGERPAPTRQESQP